MQKTKFMSHPFNSNMTSTGLQMTVADPVSAVGSRTSFWRTAMCVVMFALVSACTPSLKNLPKEPQIPTPPVFGDKVEPEPVDDVVVEPEPEPEPEPEVVEPVDNAWLNSFADNNLNEHVQTALNNNPDLWASACLLYTSPSPRDQRGSRMPSSA